MLPCEKALNLCVCSINLEEASFVRWYRLLLLQLLNTADRTRIVVQAENHLTFGWARRCVRQTPAALARKDLLDAADWSEKVTVLLQCDVWTFKCHDGAARRYCTASMCVCVNLCEGLGINMHIVSNSTVVESFPNGMMIILYVERCAWTSGSNTHATQMCCCCCWQTFPLHFDRSFQSHQRSRPPPLCPPWMTVSNPIHFTSHVWHVCNRSNLCNLWQSYTYIMYIYNICSAHIEQERERKTERERKSDWESDNFSRPGTQSEYKVHTDLMSA